MSCTVNLVLGVGGREIHRRDADSKPVAELAGELGLSPAGAADLDGTQAALVLIAYVVASVLVSWPSAAAPGRDMTSSRCSPHCGGSKPGRPITERRDPDAACTGRRDGRRPPLSIVMNQVTRVLAVIVGSFFIVRAIVEFFVIDLSNPRPTRTTGVAPASPASFWSTADLASSLRSLSLSGCVDGDRRRRTRAVAQADHPMVRSSED